jgi:MOSC domain-containing protein YiiM
MDKGLPHARISSIQVGSVRLYARSDAGEYWESAIAKASVLGPVAVEFAGVAGDAQADRIHHGGADKALLGYAHGHYQIWQQEYPAVSLQPGSFGENLTITGLDEQSCCLADVVQAGTCILQVSQPRQPCWKLSARWGISKFEVRVRQTGRTGWYYRVLQPGTITPGDALHLLERPQPDWTIARCNQVFYAQPRDPQLSRELAAIPQLAAAWQVVLKAR